MNQLYYGDNLQVLREHIADESVDLIYLDPPFNSKRDYNLLFKAPSGHDSEAQIEAFEDTWHWNQQAEREFDELLHQPNTDVAEMMKALRGFLGENDMMAYLTMMANRLLQLHRVLKSTGSLCFGRWASIGTKRRGVWQHPCGSFDPLGSHPTDPRSKISLLFSG